MFDDFGRGEKIFFITAASVVYFLIGFLVIGSGHVFGIDGLGNNDPVTARDFGMMVLWPLFALKWIIMGLWSGIVPAIQYLFS